MIKCSKPSITNLEKSFIEDALNNADIGAGPYITKFEDAWAKYNNQAFGITCTSATTALFLALKALGIGIGDEVIVPEFTMVATAWAVSYTGATPVFVDCADNLNIDVTKIVITPKTKAIIPVHIYGRQCDMSSILYIAKKNNLYVIEDMAEAHGILPESDVSCFSFYGNKILSTGEGGMCLTNNSALAEEIRKLSNMYFDKDRSLIHSKIGHNFRITNIQAAIGYAQTIRIDEILYKRRQVEKWYNEYLAKKYIMPKRDTVWMYDIDCKEHQLCIKEKLEKNYVESRFFFKPMSMQPMYLKGFDTLNAYNWSTRGLYLPTYPDLQKDSIIKICEYINED